MHNQKNTDDNIIKTQPNVSVDNASRPPLKTLNETVNPENNNEKTDNDIKINKEIAALSYLWILSVPIFLFRKDSDFIQQHAKQGLYLFGLSLIAWMISTFPYIWWIGVVFLLIYIFIITKGALAALVGKSFYIPIISDIDINQLNKIKNITKKVESKEVVAQINKKEQKEHETQDKIVEKVHNVLGDLSNKENSHKDLKDNK